MKNYNKFDPRWRLAVFAAIFIYCFTISNTIGLRPDHVFLSLVVMVFAVYGKGWGKLFLIDWSPFILFWIVYDMMRGVADSIRGYINIAGPAQLEVLLFGWLTPSDIPAFYFQEFQAVHDGTLVRVLLDVTSALAYALHFVAPVLVGWLFWHTLSERRNFYLYVYTFTVLNVMAVVTFMIYPAAPPWYVYHHGFEQPGSFMLGSAGGLVNFDKLIGSDLFSSIYDTFNSNLFAAIPSLHSGYPTLIALFIGLRFGGASWVLFAYPLLAWLAAVYLNQHYIIDLIIGSVYVAIAYWIARLLVLPRIFDRFVDYAVTSRLLLTGKDR